MLKKMIWRQTCLISALAVCLAAQACRTFTNKDEATDKSAASPTADREVLEKLKRITIPRLNIRPFIPSIYWAIINATESFYCASCDYDDTWNPSEQRGVRFAARMSGTPEFSEHLDATFRFFETPSGSLFDSLTRVCAEMDMQFSFQNGNVLILPKGERSSAMRPPPVNSPADRQVIINLKSIIIPSCVFHPPATLVDVVDFFQQASRDYDWRNVPSSQRGVDFALRFKGIAQEYSVKRDKEHPDKFTEAINKIPGFFVPNIRSASLYDLLVLYDRA